MKIISAKQKKFIGFAAKKPPSFQDQTTNRFYQTLYQVRNKALQFVEDEVSCFQEQQAKVLTVKTITR